MASALSLEKSVEVNSGLKIDQDVYMGNRISAASKFAWRIVNENIRAVSKPSPDYRPKITDTIAGIFCEPLKYPLCYSTYVNGFIYALFALKYSPNNIGYVFNLEPEERLGIVG